MSFQNPDSISVSFDDFIIVSFLPFPQMPSGRCASTATSSRRRTPPDTPRIWTLRCRYSYSVLLLLVSDGFLSLVFGKQGC